MDDRPSHPRRRVLKRDVEGLARRRPDDEEQAQEKIVADDERDARAAEREHVLVAELGAVEDGHAVPSRRGTERDELEAAPATHDRGARGAPARRGPSPRPSRSRSRRARARRLRRRLARRARLQEQRGDERARPLAELGADRRHVGFLRVRASRTGRFGGEARRVEDELVAAERDPVEVVERAVADDALAVHEDPFALPASRRTWISPRSSIVAWSRETPGSSTWTSLSGARPILTAAVADSRARRVSPRKRRESNTGRYLTRTRWRTSTAAFLIAGRRPSSRSPRSASGRRRERVLPLRDRAERGEPLATRALRGGVIDRTRVRVVAERREAVEETGAEDLVAAPGRSPRRRSTIEAASACGKAGRPESSAASFAGEVLRGGEVASFARPARPAQAAGAARGARGERSEAQELGCAVVTGAAVPSVP